MYDYMCLLRIGSEKLDRVRTKTSRPIITTRRTRTRRKNPLLGQTDRGPTKMLERRPEDALGLLVKLEKLVKLLNLAKLLNNVKLVNLDNLVILAKLDKS